MRIETEKIYKLVKKYGGVLTDDLHFMNDVDELLETACKHERGSMVTEDVQDLWAMFEFLKPDCFDRSYYSFKAHYCKHCHKKYGRYF